jgi:CheY-like chemotaxis protein
VKVLVVDDNAFIRKAATVALRKHGYDVLEAANGVEAWQLVLSASPDLVLLDIMMPEMDGLEVARRIAADPATASVPVIMLTARDDRKSVEQAAAAGVKGYILKPFSPSSLVHNVARYLPARPAE